MSKQQTYEETSNKPQRTKNKQSKKPEKRTNHTAVKFLNVKTNILTTTNFNGKKKNKKADKKRKNRKKNHTSIKFMDVKTNILRTTNFDCNFKVFIFSFKNFPCSSFCNELTNCNLKKTENNENNQK
jgi:hypothetical protein